MKRLRAGVVVAALAAIGAAPSPAPRNPEAEVLARVAQFAEAFRVADAGRLQSMLGRGYIHTNTGGRMVDREQWLDYVRSRRAELDRGVLELTRYENRDLQVRLHDGVAIVTGVNASAGKHNGAAFARQLRFTQVWQRVDAQWLRIAFHDTEVLP